MAHAVLLHIVEVEVNTIAMAGGSQDDKQLDSAAQPEMQQQQQQQVLGWLACLVGLVRQLSCQVSSSSSCDCVAAHVLEATLQASVDGVLWVLVGLTLVDAMPFLLQR
jgi:hypothetical protein